MQLPLFLPDSSWERPTELPDLRRCTEVALDTETRDDGLSAGRGSGWVYRAGHVIGFSAAWREGRTVRSEYYPIRHPDTKNFPVEMVHQWWRDHLASSTCRFIFHNAPYDLGWMRAEADVRPPAMIDDTTCMAVMLDENRLTYKLGPLAMAHGLSGKDETLLMEAGATYGVKPGDLKKKMHLLPARYVGPYGAGDAEQTLLLSELMRPLLDEQELVGAYQTEMDLIPMIQEMRLRGIRVDVERAAEAARELRRQRDVVLVELTRQLGTRQLDMEAVRKGRNLEAWHDAHKISYPRTPKTKVGSFSADWMRKHEHWLPRSIARAEQLEEAASKFIQGFIIDYSHRGRLHAEVKQFLSDDGGTRTHRLAYADPALQQMPGDKQPELKKIIRGLFLPEPGERWVALDYSQQEYRLIVHFACRLQLPGAEDARERYLTDPKTDFHQLVADMTGLPRRNAKDVNFAKVFGAGIPQFASMTGLAPDRAKQIMEQYDEQLPFPRALSQECSQLANQRGWVRMIDGARAHYDRWEPAWRDGNAYVAVHSQEAARKKWPGQRLKRAFTHKAMNALIQGSAARQTKIGMVQCWREKLVPLIQMHDELSFSFSNQRDAVRAAEIMRDAVRLEVPMLVDAEFGASWGDARHTWEEAA